MYIVFKTVLSVVYYRYYVLYFHIVESNPLFWYKFTTRWWMNTRTILHETIFRSYITDLLYSNVMNCDMWTVQWCFESVIVYNSIYNNRILSCNCNENIFWFGCCIRKIIIHFVCYIFVVFCGGLNVLGIISLANNIYFSV